VVVVDHGVPVRREDGAVDPRSRLAPADARAIAATVASEVEAIGPASADEIRRALGAI
jgi:hypothetical protein